MIGSSSLAGAIHPTTLAEGLVLEYRTMASEGISLAWFADGSRADAFEMTYRARILATDGISAEVGLSLEISAAGVSEGRPGGVLYYLGEEFARRANEGDWSFVRAFEITPEDRNRSLITLPSDDFREVPGVQVPGPLTRRVERTVLIDLVHGTYQATGEPRGVWPLWVDPDRIDFEEGRPRPLLERWATGAVAAHQYQVAASAVPAELLAGRQSSSLVLWVPDSESGQLSIPEPSRFADRFLPSRAYDARSGFLIGTAGGMYADDVLIDAGVLGIESAVGRVMRADAEVEAAEGRSLPALALGPLLAIFLAAALARRDPA